MKFNSVRQRTQYVTIHLKLTAKNATDIYIVKGLMITNSYSTYTLILVWYVMNYEVS